MKPVFFLFLFLWTSAFSQEIVETSFVKKSKMDAERIVSIDVFGSVFYLNNNVFYKKNSIDKISYNNLQLGDLETVDVFNPLKINLFYKNFNTVVILDNRLAEIFKIDFNNLATYKNVTHVSTGHDNTLWLFNQDTQQLELYDYRTNTNRVYTLPIQEPVLDLKSNYNTCWLLTKTHLFVYNYFGSLLKKMKHDGFTSMSEGNNHLILKKDNYLYYLKHNTENPILVSTPKLLINQFLLTNGSLYIYDNEFLHEYQLIKD
ncbi:hypothetical protein L3X37_04205 [Sabulilitoribacter arenilitoris]|uniref:Uncharacterized protein n=1 Tax=Wocania arenilitoris TaxID=2044858 RepID=A0AAE3ELJ2_9FLAO|nr:hypothetical protein [Wocania arenilitoris]MCF7567568.1 hypothetical protein [Wocania arenilitoris]